MRRSPSIVPYVSDRDVYLVLDDFGRLGRSWRETDEDRTDRSTIIRDFLDGQFNYPVRVVSFNTAEGWSRDVSAEIARELAQLAAEEDQSVPPSTSDFLDRYLPAPTCKKCERLQQM